MAPPPPPPLSVMALYLSPRPNKERRRPDNQRLNPHLGSLEFLLICPTAFFSTREVGSCSWGPFLVVCHTSRDPVSARPEKSEKSGLLSLRRCSGADRDSHVLGRRSSFLRSSFPRSIPVMRFGNCSDLIRWPPRRLPQLLRENERRARWRTPFLPAANGGENGSSD